MAGRRPLSKKVHDARGNAGKRKHAPNPEPLRAIPEAPDFVQSDPAALAEWNRIAPEQFRTGSLTAVDGAILGIYAAGFALAQRLFVKGRALFDSIPEKDFVQLTKNGPKPNPYLDVAQIFLNSALKTVVQVRGAMIETGLTPSSRGRLKVPQAIGEAESAREKAFDDLQGGL